VHHRSRIFLFALLIASFGFAGCSGLVAGNSAPPSTLVITNIQSGSVTTSSSQVVWTTNVPANSSVDYGTTTTYGNSTPVDSTMVTSHQVTLSGLAAGTTYYYQVNSTDSKGNHGHGGNKFNTGGFSLSGTINPTAAGNGATVALSGGASTSATADSSGNYTFAGLANGSYMVTPKHTGYAFAPGNQSATVNGANITGVNFTATAAPVAPSITTQPASQTVTAGQTASFSVAATGTAPLTYQWQKNSVAISGATSSNYTTPATISSDNGAQFTVVVTNTAGSVTSNAAALTVSATPVAPSITTQPASRTVTAGQTTSFRVEAAGTAPLTYQWQKNGVAISAATSSGYTIPVTSETIIGVGYAVLAHILFVFLRRLWNWFRQPKLTLLVIPYPESPNAIRTTPSLGRPQVVELRVKVSSEERTSRRGDAPRAKQRTTKKRAGRQHRTKAVIVDCPSVCPNCGHSTSGENEGN
jgi:hypothetical protein